MSDEPVPAQLAPYPADVVEGRRYAWCACGRSQRQPFCDGSHKDTGIEPVMFIAKQTETVWLCGCKGTEDAPFCDGSHNLL